MWHLKLQHFSHNSETSYKQGSHDKCQQKSNSVWFCDAKMTTLIYMSWHCGFQFPWWLHLTFNVTASWHNFIPLKKPIHFTILYLSFLSMSKLLCANTTIRQFQNLADGANQNTEDIWWGTKLYHAHSVTSSSMINRSSWAGETSLTRKGKYCIVHPSANQGTQYMMK